MSASATQREPATPLELAFEHGTDHELALALRDYIEESLMVREGWVIDIGTSRERANNLAQGLAGLIRGSR